MIQSHKDRILVRPVKVEKKSTLILTAKEDNFQTGLVVSIGEEVKYVEVGDFIWTRCYEGIHLTYDEVEYVSISQDTVLAFSKELR